MSIRNTGPHKPNGDFYFTDEGEVRIQESAGNQTREPWLMLLARRGQALTRTLCWGLTSTGSSFARIGTQEGDLVNGFVHEDPYKAAPLGQYIYIVDESGGYGTATWYPVRKPGQELETTFGFGYVRYRTGLLGLESELTCFVTDHADAMVQILRLKNNSGTKRRLRLFSVVPVNVGDARDIGFSGFNTLMLGGSYVDRELGANVYRNNFGVDLDEHETDDDDTGKSGTGLNGMFSRVLVHASSLEPSAYGTRYEDFVGHHSNGMLRPAALNADIMPSRDSEDACSSLSSLRCEVELEAGETRDLVFVAVAAGTRDYFLNGKAEVKKLLQELKDPARAWARLDEVKDGWKAELDLQDFDLPADPVVGPSIRWLQYQCKMVILLNRMKSRFHSGFEYGFGFRDILQDILALLPYRPAAFLDIIPWVAGQMFSDGSVYHNFYVRTRGNRDFVACDDPLWLVYALCEYVKETGDASILALNAPYADAQEGMPAKEGSIMEHLHTALDRVWLNSDRGLPRLMQADWNDDLSDYEDHLSVFCAIQLYKALVDAAELLEHLGRENEKAMEYRRRAAITLASIKSRAVAPDGSYIRLIATRPGTVDLGSPGTDGLTFFEPLSWSGFAGVVDAEGFGRIKKIVEARLDDQFGVAICQGDRSIAQKRIPADYAAWKRSAPGKKENGGEFRHLESWYSASLCRFAYGKEAWNLFYKTLPAVCSKNDPYRYAAERFVYPEYVSGPASYEYGRAGHTWLTGTAPTRLGVLFDWILGLRRSYRGLEIDPCVHPEWKLWTARRYWRGTLFEFTFRNPKGLQKGRPSIIVDGKSCKENFLSPGFCDGASHRVEVELL